MFYISKFPVPHISPTPKLESVKVYPALFFLYILISIFIGGCNIGSNKVESNSIRISNSEELSLDIDNEFEWTYCGPWDEESGEADALVVSVGADPFMGLREDSVPSFWRIQLWVDKINIGQAYEFPSDGTISNPYPADVFIYDSKEDDEMSSS